MAKKAMPSRYWIMLPIFFLQANPDAYCAIELVECRPGTIDQACRVRWRPVDAKQLYIMS